MIGVNRRRVMGGGGGTPLPYDAEIEYLESTGTQWLDTGIPVVNGILMEYYGAFGSNNPIVSAMGDSSVKYLRIYIYNKYNLSVWKAGVSEYIRVNPLQNTFYNIYHDSRGLSNIVKWNGSEVLNEDTTGYSNPDTNVRVFNDLAISAGKIRTLKLTDNNGDVVLDWKAVRVGQVGYMYDNITGTLHGNDGEDSFILGNDL